MKIFYFLCISVFCLMAMSSCEDNGANTENNKFRKMKITIYVSYSGDTNDFVKNSEYYFDGDVAGFAKRCYWQKYGVSNYQSILEQQRSNVPLPLYKYGCLIQNIEYDNDSTRYSITHPEYDKDGYVIKYYLDFEVSADNKSIFGIFTRQGDNLTMHQYYQENALKSVSKYFYDANGLCTYEVDSSVSGRSVQRSYRRYNDKKQLVHLKMDWDESALYTSEYFYDNEGNNIKQLEYVVNNSDTTDVEVRNWVIYKGYRIEQEQIDRFIFDSNDNIIGYISSDFGNTRYKIEYLYY